MSSQLYCRNTLLLALAMGFVLRVPSAHAILFSDPAATSTTNTSAPTGGFAGSGWQYEGYFGSYLGTMISPNLFVTAQHIGVNSSTFSYDTVFSGAATVNYSVNTAANGGTGYWDIAGTDLRVYQISGGTFSTYAPLYSGVSDIGSNFVVLGRGGPRGTAITGGYLLGSSDGQVRWGTNTFDSTATYPGLGTLLTADFSPGAGANEAGFSYGDSGGGAFINVGGVWKLAGINYGVEGSFDTNNVTGDHTEFSAALTDKGGYWEGSDATGWTFVPNTAGNQATLIYLSRISASESSINTLIVTAPEPGSAVMILGALVGFGFHRRR